MSATLLARRSLRTPSRQILFRAYAVAASPSPSPIASSSTSPSSSLPASALSPPSDYDIVIIGGGVAGLSLAAALGSRPTTSHLKTCLIEASDLSKIEAWKPKDGEWSNRISSVTNENRGFLKTMGGWSYVNQHRLGPIEEMQVWDSLTPSRITFTAPAGTGMSTLVENLNLQYGMLRMLREQAKNVELMGGTRVEGIERETGVGGAGEWPVVRVTGGKGLRARLVIGADGLRSPVRKFAGIESHGHSYNTHTIVSVMTHNPYPSPPTPRTLTAFQRFLPSGPLAFLPLTNNQASLAWHIHPPELSLAVKSLPEESLVLMINACYRIPEHGVKHLLERILASHQADPTKPFAYSEILSTIALIENSSGTIQPHSHLSLLHPPSPTGIPPHNHDLVPPLVLSMQPGATASFPLAYSHAESYVSPRVALVGDAAHTIHPHCGMGLNMGLGDVRSLVEHLEKGMKVGGDLGSMVTLKGYERERWVKNQVVMTATDGLEKMFRTENKALRWVRGLGMDVLQELEGVKGLIMKQSGGDGAGSGLSAPSLPSLAQVASAANGLKNVAGGLGDLVGRGIKGAVDGVLSSRR